jgi:polar amino acid transport system substrate-binding protein
MRVHDACFFLLALRLGFLLPGNAGAAELKFNTQDFAPYNYEIHGVVAGPAADVVRKICAEMKIDCPMRLLSWKRAQEEVGNGTAHGLFVVAWNKVRAKTYFFSPPLVNTEYGFFVRDDNPLEFKQNSDVKGYRVGVFGPSNTSDALEQIKAEIKELTIDMTPDDESAFRKLSAGRVDAVFSNRQVGDELARLLKLKNLRYAGRQQRLKYYIGFSQRFADKKLVDQFNATFRSLHKRGVIKEILAKYNMQDAQLE